MRNDGLKILFYIKDPHGGPARFLENISKLIKKKSKYKTIILTNKKLSLLDSKTKQIGFDIEKQTSFSPLNFYLTIANLFLLYREIKKYAPDVIFSLDVYANLSCNLISLFYRKAVLINSSRVNLEEHIKNERSKLFSSFIKNVINFLYQLADLHVVPSTELGDQLVTKFGMNKTKVVFIPNAIDIHHVKKLSKKKIRNGKLNKLLGKKDIVKIFSMGRFDKQKGFENLFYATARLRNYSRKIRLFILGDGPLKTFYMNLIKKLDMEKYIFFLGWQKNPYQFLRFADIFILVTNYEACPNSLLEALSLGIPTMASDVDFGPREILDHGKYGILLKNNSPEEIEKKIKQVMKNRKLRSQLRQLSKVRIREYNLQNTWNRIQPLFNKQIS
jgi:glycosyltransferase involved in cell wall biosynthesis